MTNTIELTNRYNHNYVFALVDVFTLSASYTIVFMI